MRPLLAGDQFDFVRERNRKEGPNEELQGTSREKSRGRVRARTLKERKTGGMRQGALSVGGSRGGSVVSVGGGTDRVQPRKRKTAAIRGAGVGPQRSSGKGRKALALAKEAALRGSSVKKKWSGGGGAR